MVCFIAGLRKGIFAENADRFFYQFVVFRACICVLSLLFGSDFGRSIEICIVIEVQECLFCCTCG